MSDEHDTTHDPPATGPGCAHDRVYERHTTYLLPPHWGQADHTRFASAVDAFDHFGWVCARHGVGSAEAQAAWDDAVRVLAPRPLADVHRAPHAVCRQYWLLPTWAVVSYELNPDGRPIAPPEGSVPAVEGVQAEDAGLLIEALEEMVAAWRRDGTLAKVSWRDAEAAGLAAQAARHRRRAARQHRQP